MPGKPYTRLRHIMPTNALTEREKTLKYGTQHASTASTKSQRTTRSSEQDEHMILPGQWTEPTSQPRTAFDIIDKESVKQKHEEPTSVQPKRIDSDLEVQYGSDSIHSWGSAKSHSSSLDDGRADLPRPTTELKMKAIGGLFGDAVPRWEEPTAFPNDENEARLVMDKIERACATTRAADKFESHLQPDSALELCVQRDQILGSWVKRRMLQPIRIRQDPPMVDVEKQRAHRVRNNKARATMIVLAIGLVFIALVLSLYANLCMA